eukprot:4245114-Lingulodinium_polyedra.AAC.1
MNHVRRISQSSIRWRQCVRTVDQDTEHVLERMKNIVEPPLPAPDEDVSPDDSISQVSTNSVHESVAKPLGVAVTTAKTCKFHVVHGKNQSYIQSSGPTKKLLVACSKSQHKDHCKVIDMIVQFMESKGSEDKAFAKELRDHLIA